MTYQHSCACVCLNKVITKCLNKRKARLNACAAQMSLSDLVYVAKPSGLVAEQVLDDMYERKLERLRSVPWAMQVRPRVS